MCLTYPVCKGQIWNSDPYLLKPYLLDYLLLNRSLVQKAKATGIQEK